MSPRFRLLALTLFALLALVGCSSQPTPPNPQPSSSAAGCPPGAPAPSFRYGSLGLVPVVGIVPVNPPPPAMHTLTASAPASGPTLQLDFGAFMSDFEMVVCIAPPPQPTHLGAAVSGMLKS